MNAEQIFQKANFVYEYRKESEEFYRTYFPDDGTMEAFFVSIFLNEDEERKPRQMMNQIKRFVTLANDIDKIRPGHDPLRILFLRICLESLCEISGSNKKSFYESFERFFSDDGKSYVLRNFTFSDISAPEDLAGWDKLLFNTHEDYDLSFTDFMRIIRAVRNNLVHDGDYWTMQFFARDSDSTWLVNMQTDEKIIECQEKGDVKEFFEVLLEQYIPDRKQALWSVREAEYILPENISTVVIDIRSHFDSLCCHFYTPSTLCNVLTKQEFDGIIEHNVDEAIKDCDAIVGHTWFIETILPTELNIAGLNK